MKTASLVVGTVCLLAAAPGLVFSDDAPEPDSHLKRWAILADDDLRKTGISDLLAVELTSPGFELVEREQIDAVLAEQQLARSFGAVGTANRVQLGQLLHADALVLLRRDAAGQTPGISFPR